MKNEHFTTTILVDQSRTEVFNAINNVRGWWSEEIEGSTTSLNDEFTYHYEDVHRCKLKIIELVANQKVVWQVITNYFSFTKDTTEWTGTNICFDIAAIGNKTQLTFTHIGLVPGYECYNTCNEAWNNYIQRSLYNLIITGKGLPNGKGKPQTISEEKLAAK